MSHLLDSNILIYHLKGQLTDAGKRLLTKIILAGGSYSTISKIEVLGYPQSTEGETQTRLLLSGLNEIELTSEIAERTIQLRKHYRIKLPDAVIAATALESKLTLVTRNERDFEKIPSIQLLNPFELVD